MQKIKKISLLFSAIAIILVLAGCGGKTEEKSEKLSEPNIVEKKAEKVTGVEELDTEINSIDDELDSINDDDFGADTLSDSEAGL